MNIQAGSFRSGYEGPRHDEISVANLRDQRQTVEEPQGFVFVAARITLEPKWSGAAAFLAVVAVLLFR